MISSRARNQRIALGKNLNPGFNEFSLTAHRLHFVCIKGDFTLKETRIVSNGFCKDDIAHNGNKFLTGNGYFGVRGTLEEFEKDNMCAVNMAGIYDKAGDGWRESVNAPNPLFTYVVIDGAKYSAQEVEPFEHTQELDIEKGIHRRSTVWKTKNGNFSVEAERFASMANKHFIGLGYSVAAEFDCDIEIFTGIDGDVWDINGPHFKEIETDSRGGVKSVCGITGEKGISVKTEECVTLDFDAECEDKVSDKRALSCIRFKAKAGTKYTFKKVAAVSSSVDENELVERVEDIDFDVLKSEHIKAWSDIWNISYVEIDGDNESEFALNYSIYHLNCIAPRENKSMSIAARGLSGQVYKGAVFWDTEMFMLDYFLYTEPEIAKTLLMYRVDTLEGALDKAKSYGLDGAFYAWESQEGGLDACSDYNIVDVFTKRPMRTFFKDKQVHISAAVVYAIDKYVRITGDTSVLESGGGRVIYECAKFYRSLMLKYANKEFHEIHDVVGPDEYHERVNNNAYTNEMARFVLRTAAKYAEYIDGDTSEYAELAETLRRPNIDKDGVIEQFDGYFKLEDCSVDTVRSRLLDPKEYWGGAYGVASDTKVIKQADVVAMLCMLPEGYDKTVMSANLKYYEPRTEHGSSLSACMYSLLSCKTGDPEFAYPFFVKSASADLTKGGKEWAGLVYIGGTHPASEGGAWMVAVEGFAGMRIENGEIVCNPCLPKKWNGMKFKISYNKNLYEIKITKDDWKVEKL